MKKKCVPEGQQKSHGKGKGKARGQGGGPMGVPTKEADQLVDDILNGKYADVKLTEKAQDMVDVILDMCGKDHGKKKKMKEAVNAIDHVPNENADELTSNIEDELGKEEETRTESTEELIKRAYDSVMEDQMFNEEILIKKAYDAVMEEKAISQESKRVTSSEMKKKVAAAKAKCSNVKDRDERTKCIYSHIKNSMKK